MKVFIGILTLLTIAAIKHVNASDEILNILNTAKDLTLQELNALRPLFDELQKQYDYITEALKTEDESDIVSWQKEIWPHYTKEDHLHVLDNMLVLPKVLPTIEYDTKLPTVDELIGNIDVGNANLTKEQLAEREDMQEILQETLKEAQFNINELVRRALLIESELLKLNKPKIITYIYKALSQVFRYSTRLRRAAYCVYSYLPDLNDSLQNINAGVECYEYTMSLVLRIQTETVKTVSTIRRNVYDLAVVYKKIAAKHSLMGKIITSLMNIQRIARNIRESYEIAMEALNDMQTELPIGVINTINCSTDFAESLPQILCTADNVTTCITLIDTKTEYEFLLPENERDFNFSEVN